MSADAGAELSPVDAGVGDAQTAVLGADPRVQTRRRPERLSKHAGLAGEAAGAPIDRCGPHAGAALVFAKGPPATAGLARQAARQRRETAHAPFAGEFAVAARAPALSVERQRLALDGRAIELKPRSSAVVVEAGAQARLCEQRRRILRRAQIGLEVEAFRRQRCTNGAAQAHAPAEGVDLTRVERSLDRGHASGAPQLAAQLRRTQLERGLAGDVAQARGRCCDLGGSCEPPLGVEFSHKLHGEEGSFGVGAEGADARAFGAKRDMGADAARKPGEAGQVAQLGLRGERPAGGRPACRAVHHRGRSDPQVETRFPGPSVAVAARLGANVLLGHAKRARKHPSGRAKRIDPQVLQRVRAIERRHVVPLGVGAAKFKRELLQRAVAKFEGAGGDKRRALSEHRRLKIESGDIHRSDANVQRCALALARLAQRGAAQNPNAACFGVLDVHRAAEKVERAPVENEVLGLDPNASRVGDADAIGAQRADPASADAFHLDAAQPPDALAVGDVVDDPGRARSEREPRAGKAKRAAGEPEPQAAAFARSRAQNAWPKLI